MGDRSQPMEGADKKRRKGKGKTRREEGRGAVGRKTRAALSRGEEEERVGRRREGRSRQSPLLAPARRPRPPARSASTPSPP